MRYAYPTFSPFHGEKKREENAKDILYIENDDTGFSFTQSKPISFKGYALKDGYPEFIYKTGTITVTEKITLGSKPKSFKRYFTVTGLPRQNKPISLNLAHKTKGDIPISITSSRGHLMNNVLHLTTAEASQFNVEVVLP
jgi:hypothetical protein